MGRRYSFVGVDPRGVGYSEKFQCATVRESDYDQADTFPYTNAQISSRIFDDFAFRRECAKANPRLAQFMTTADYARDLDLVRQALGDDEMNMLGMQYGSHVAATYMNLFPSKVGNIVIDSAFDSNAWARPSSFTQINTPASARLSGTKAARRAWEAIITECERLGVDRCASAETLREDWTYLHEVLPQRPVNLDGNVLDYGAYVAMEMKAGRYVTSLARLTLTIPKIAEALRAQEAGQGVDSRGATASREDQATWAVVQELRDSVDPQAANSSVRGTLLPPRLMQPALGVMCSETFNPIDPTGIRRAAGQQNSIKPGEGAARVWHGPACAQWPFRGKNAYRGDYRTPAAKGALIVGNEFDTSTPYQEGAVKMRNTLHGSKLVTVEKGFGTYAYFNSQCARKIVGDFFVTGNLPEQDQTCAPRNSFEDALGFVNR